MLESFDLRDATDRLVCADWLAEQGRDVEAALVRLPGTLFVKDGEVGGIDEPAMAQGMAWEFLRMADLDDEYSADEWTGEARRLAEGIVGRFLAALPNRTLAAYAGCEPVIGEGLAAAFDGPARRCWASFHAGFTSHGRAVRAACLAARKGVGPLYASPLRYGGWTLARRRSARAVADEASSQAEAFDGIPF